MSKVLPNGYGTYHRRGVECQEMVEHAINEGIQHIDLAWRYGNEPDVGKVLAKNIVPRDTLFITTKVWASDIVKGRKRIIHCIKRSLEYLHTDYLDLVLLHLPVQESEKNLEAWQTLEDIVLGYIPELHGKVKNIGVSNYKISDLKNLQSNIRVKPFVNQIEVSPFCQRRKLRNYCNDHNIPIVAHSSLTAGHKLDECVLQEIANKHSATPAQVLLQWGNQEGCTVIPSTTDKDHFKENYSIGFTLGNSDFEVLDSLDGQYCVFEKYL